MPTFVIIGAQRCATRWLKVNLNKHPDIYVPPAEIDFWNDPERRAKWTMNGYRRKFDGWDESPITGEASPSYLFYDSYPFELAEPARAMWKQIPDLRVIALVRDPVDRFESAIRHYVKNKSLPRDFDVFADWNDASLTDLRLIQQSQYGETLEPYALRFGEQLQVVFVDDVVADPAAAYRSVLRHIGADEGFVPPDIERVLFSTAASVAVPPLTPDQRNLVRAIMVPSIEKLEQLTGRDLSHWKAAES